MNFMFFALFAVLPWLQYNGHQAILFDISEQRFTIWGLTLWPQDLTLLAWIFIFGAFFYSFFCYHIFRSGLVRLYMPTNRMDLYFYVV